MGSQPTERPPIAGIWPSAAEISYTGGGALLCCIRRSRFSPCRFRHPGSWHFRFGRARSSEAVRPPCTGSNVQIRHLPDARRCRLPIAPKVSKRQRTFWGESSPESSDSRCDARIPRLQGSVSDLRSRRFVPIWRTVEFEGRQGSLRQRKQVARDPRGIGAPDDILPAKFVLGSIAIPGDVWCEPLPVEMLSRNWDAMGSANQLATKAIGDEWVRSNRSAVLKVPSVVSGESNLLLNPAHPDFARLVLMEPVPFPFDPRLLRRMP